MLLRYGRSAWQSGQGCFLAKTGPRASRRCVRRLRGPSGEPKVCSSPEGALGRDVNPPGSAALARGWAQARRDRVP
jgi:hypothetical protein